MTKNTARDELIKIIETFTEESIYQLLKYATGIYKRQIIKEKEK